MGEAIESILSQTFKDFEFIVVNDGSTDGTTEIVDSFKRRDSRIRLYHQSKCGVASAMNLGCDSAKGKYIARMDSDDISLPRRLSAQVALLEKNPRIGICGTWMQRFCANAIELRKFPTEPDIIHCLLPFQFPLASASIMFRRELLARAGIRYRSTVGTTDDYLFVVECSKHCLVTSVAEALYRYRIHAAQVTETSRDQNRKFAGRIRLCQLTELGLNPAENELAVHDALAEWRMVGDPEFIECAEKWLVKIRNANAYSQIYSQAGFEKVLSDYWFAVCTRNTRLGLWTFNKYVGSSLSKISTRRATRKSKLMAKCLVRHQ